MKKFIKNYVLIGQKALLVNKEGKILLLKRSAQTPRPGGWDFVGGGLDKGEDPIKGIKREISEETGLKVSKISPISIISHNEGKDFVVLIFYKAQVTGKVKLSWEHENFKWVSKNQALKMDIPLKMKDVIKLII